MVITMNKIINARFLAISGLILLAALSRLFPHPPNFSPLTAIALFAGAYLADKRLAFAVPVLAMLISDLFLGFHETMLTVYFAFACIVGIGFLLRTNVGILRLLTASIGSAVIFFIITNFGVWLFSGMYELSVAGLALCFEMAVPFFRSTLESSLIYSAVMFGSFALAVKYLPKLAIAKSN